MVAFFIQTPRDANFPNPTSHATCLLRPEFIDAYCKHRALKAVMADGEATKAIKGVGGKAREEKKGEAEGGGEEEATGGGGAEEGEGGEQESFDRHLASIRFNVDVLSDCKLGDEEALIQSDQAQVREAASFLLNHVLPSMVQELASLQLAPSDGAALTAAMHKRGINVRYLGRLAALCKEARLKHMEDLCTMEMVARSAKHLLRKALRQRAYRLTHPHLLPHSSHSPHPSSAEPSLAALLAGGLSALVGAHCMGHGLTEGELAAAGRIAALLSKMDVS